MWYVVFGRKFDTVGNNLDSKLPNFIVTKLLLNYIKIKKKEKEI